MPLFTSPFHLGLIGYPLGHSLSPQIHTAALQSCNLEGAYSLFPVPPDDTQGLKDLLARLRSGEIQGLNVTIPHKQTVMQFLDQLTPTAQSIGAVNTIYMRENKLIGDNTDAPGFLTDLKRFLVGRKSSIVNRKSSLVLGAGGAARAVAYALLNDGWEVTLVARRMEQAAQLALSFPNYEIHTMDYETFILHRFDYAQRRPSAFSLFVNATPLGMTPNIDQSPWPANLSFPPPAAIYDLVYNPRETKLTKDACSQGLSATTGLGMLIEQAALSFEIWTGHEPPRKAMFSAVHQSAH